MLTALRHACQAHLMQAEALRKPALRRSAAPDALLATDLPLAAPPERVASFCRDMAAEGWSIREEKGWLLLDHPVPPPPMRAVTDFSGEAGCCLWLLLHHPDPDCPAEWVRALVKAAEEGPAALARLCRIWHGELARRLREGRPLPGGLAPYLAEAICLTKEDKP